MMKSVVSVITIACLVAAFGGCSAEPEVSDRDSHHHHEEIALYMPTSLGDLCSKLRVRLKRCELGQIDSQVKNELADLVSWVPEFAADTNINEATWIPIYESSERVRLAIEKDPDQWDEKRLAEITELCSISEHAWLSLDVDQRVERYQNHAHNDHDHGDHDHGDHDHGDHDHGDHDHGDHDHGDHDHGDHDHGDHDHGDHDHGDHSGTSRESGRVSNGHWSRLSRRHVC